MIELAKCTRAMALDTPRRDIHERHDRRERKARRGGMCVEDLGEGCRQSRDDGVRQQGWWCVSGVRVLVPGRLPSNRL